MRLQLPAALAGLATRAEVSLIWVRLGNCRKRDLLLAIERVWPRVRERLEAGERIVEIR